MGDEDAEIPFESPHPYGNNGDCTWTYEGLDRNGATSPCISTPTGSVRLTTDGSVVAQGFTVDAAVAC